MHHFTLDGFHGFRSRFDDIRLVHELMEEIPETLDVQPVMPPALMPYYNGVVAEDCGISAFVLLAGGHLTLHTFSFRECYFADVVYPAAYDSRQLKLTLESSFPCRINHTAQVTRSANDAAARTLADGPTAPDEDFGPHLFMDVEGYTGPTSMDAIFQVFDSLPQRIGMTPIMRPYVLTGKAPSGEPVTSALTMIAESHIAIHIFPERRAAYFDIFSCRFFDQEPVVKALREVFPGSAHHVALVARGRGYTTYRSERQPEMQRAKAWLKAL